MAHFANRRRFLQTAVGSSVGAWVATGVSGQAASPEGCRSRIRSQIPDAGGVARKFWIDPSIAAWRPGPWRKVHIEYHTSRHMPKLARAVRRGRVRRPVAGGARQRRDRLRQGHVRLFLLPEHARADAPEPLLRPSGGAGGGAEEAEHLGPRLLHADLESGTRRAASRMAGRPPARRQVPPQARGGFRRAEGVHEYR